MKLNYIFFVIIITIFISNNIIAQIAINTDGSAPDPSAMLDVKSTNKGMLVPRVTLTSTADIATVPNRVESLLIYNTATAGTSPNNVVPGYYYWSGGQWNVLKTSVTASNGITKNVDAVELGGSLTKPTAISLGSNTLDFSSATGNISFDSPTTVIDVTNNRVGFGTTTPQGLVDFTSTNSTIILPRVSNPSTAIGANSKVGMIAYDAATNTIKYYNSTSWLDLQNSITASNGITKNVNAVELGGSLTKPTAISLGANTLDFSSTTGNISFDSPTTVIDVTNNRVGIGTTTPQGLVDFTSTNNTIILPRISTPETTVGANAKEGMVLYDPSSKALKMYDGVSWKVISSNATYTRNEGVVKINTGSGSPNIPTFNNPSSNTTYNVTYALPLTYGISAWPENLTSPTDADIYNTSNNRFIENPITNQTHIWRVTVSYTKSSNLYSQELNVSLYNPNTGFRVTSVGTIASQRTSGSITYYLITVADSSSIGTGYQLQWSCTDSLTKLTVDNITRVSQYKD